MSDWVISKETADRKRRYVIKHEGGGESDLTYSALSESRVIADHAVVDPAFEGQGLGLALVQALIADAEADGFKIIPLCPYVNAQRRKHPEWASYFDV
ncbi:MAG: GNAT family N-acetyltransferase [Pseudomonadota bacterium]